MNREYELLHKFFNSLSRVSFPYDESNIEYSNGIYIMFEEGEAHDGYDRITRVGTHKGVNQLRGRLKEHYINPNKNRSIFRKNIGRCLLKQEEHPYMCSWELDSSKPDIRTQNSSELDFAFEQLLEKQITSYIQRETSFVTIQVDHKETRMWLEAKLIATIAQGGENIERPNWLGNDSPKPKIRKYGLWQEQHVQRASFDLKATEAVIRKFS